MEKVKVGVIGNTGRSGQVLQQLLSKHPFIEIIYTSSSKKSEGEKKYVEVMFLALPTEISLREVPTLLKEGKKVIDLSRACRLDANAVYGLPEHNRAKIKVARLIANPGCYATSVILGILPIKHNVENIKIDSVSGVSGAGKYPVEDGIVAYKVGREHDHIKEIEKELGLKEVLFVPKCIMNLDRGIVSTIHATLKEKINVSVAWGEYYSNERFVRMKATIGTKSLVGTNYCDIAVHQYGKEIIILSALDNLMKGAAGQAVQNMNILCGFDEETGLI